MQWYFIGLIVSAVAVLAFGLFTKNINFKKMVYDLVVMAELEIKGTKMGQEKFAWVVAQIFFYVPSELKWCVTEARITKVIEWAVAKMKKQLEK